MANENNNIQATTDDSQIVLYQPDESISLQVKIEEDTVWLTQAQMVELFGSSKANISEHITNIYQQGELMQSATVRKFRTVRKEGKLQHDEMQRIKDVQAKQQQQLDFFIRTSTPPAEMVFFEGDFYTARVALENLVRSANHRVIIIDGYVSSLTLPQQSYRY